MCADGLQIIAHERPVALSDPPVRVPARESRAGAVGPPVGDGTITLRFDAAFTSVRTR
jgi:hypothetical protein